MRRYVEDGFVDRIRAAGGEIYAITSEPQHLADEARTHWALTFSSIGDPHQEISRVCSERGWLTLYANRGRLTFLQRGADWRVEHPKGYFQPGVLALTSSGRILYRWRSVPSAANLSGTLARPTAAHVWTAIDSALEAGAGAGDAAHDDDPVLDSKPPPRVLFVAALIANGWFLGVRAFAYSPGVGSVPSRFAGALSRWLLFLGVWVAAFSLLPALPVALALAGWAIWIRHDIRHTLGAMDQQRELTADG